MIDFVSVELCFWVFWLHINRILMGSGLKYSVPFYYCHKIQWKGWNQQLLDPTNKHWLCNQSLMYSIWLCLIGIDSNFFFQRLLKTHQHPAQINRTPAVRVCQKLVRHDWWLTNKSQLLNSVDFLMWSIRRIRPCLSADAAQFLAQALVISRIDYCYSLLAGLPPCTIKSLQMTQNVVAHLVFNQPKTARVPLPFRSLPWLPVAQNSKPRRSPTKQQPNLLPELDSPERVTKLFLVSRIPLSL